jgi:hypothetical protein
MTAEIIKLKKSAHSILRVDPSDLSSNEYRKLRSNASSVADWAKECILNNGLDEDTMCELGLLIRELREVARG